MIYAAPATGPDAFSPIWDDALSAGVLWRRVFGWMIDVLLVVLIVWTIWWSLVLFGLVTFGLTWVLLAFVPLVPFAYHCLFLTGEMSATPGQAAFGLIVRRNYDLGRPTLAQAVVSTLIFYVTLATTGLLLLVALFTYRKRTLHDLVSGLVVVRRRVWRNWALAAGAAFSGPLTGDAGSWNMGAGQPPT
jgi:uncharacterized RDD family membrane protein YckC